MNGQELVKDYTSLLVAKYLRDNHFDDTLVAFLKESSIPKNALNGNEDGTSSNRNDDEENLLNIIKERVKFNEYNISNNLKNLNLNTQIDPNILSKFNLKSWNHHIKYNMINKLELSNLILSAKFSHDKEDNIFLTNATKELIVYDNRLNNLNGTFRLPNVVKLFGRIVKSSFNYICTMNGEIFIFKNFQSLTEDHWKLHSRMITHVNFFPIDDETKSYYVISCGMDQLLKISLLTLQNDNSLELIEIDSIKLPSNCTAMEVQSDNGKPIIFITRIDFTQVVCFHLNDTKKLSKLYSVALNNTQFSTHSFNVRDMIIINDSILAIATSHIPYMRLILVEIPTGNTITTESGVYYNKIIRNIVTEIAQNSLSQPIIKYWQTGNGIIVGCDDGLFAIDLNKGESWSLNKNLNIPNNIRVKDIDIQGRSNLSKIVVTFSDKSVGLWESKE